ncbi:MAG TPA: CDP-diacylglycerol--glycerol-3-phosphate 3-phosphatidyltransferase [Longimicrobiaceae bacterium]|nr:CDP-diacylglycerol--glycerol-3-phosphate 3-phosphatidyltransferase [Longimicrobiaceae bacterium]
MRGLNLPNLITIGRIVLAAVLVPLLFVDDFETRVAAFVIFLAAAFSDLWDGHLARSQGLITDLGKLLDPLADKLLLAATFTPFVLLSHSLERESRFPWFGGVFPLWIVAIIFGRELFITMFRGYAARRGVVLAAGKPGKYKAVFQNIFIGAAILWYALQSEARDRGWDGPMWAGWQVFHFWFTVVVLSVAVILTVYSLVVYLRTFSRLDLGDPGAR